MPIYVFRCHPCDLEIEEYRKMDDYRPPRCSTCSTRMEHILVPPTMHVWKQDRRFPNVSPTGDGTQAFPTRAAYERHLREHHMAESSTETRRRPSTAEITVYR